MALTRINNQALTNVTSAGLPSGSVIQVQKGTLTTQVGSSSITGATWTDTGLSVTITPTSSSSDIVLSMTTSGLVNNAGYVGIRLVRDSTTLTNYWVYNNTASWMPCFPSVHYVDSPSTTSAITYKIQIYVGNTGTNFRFNYPAAGGTTTETVMTAMEIAG